VDAALRALAHPGRRQMLALVWDAERTSSELASRCGFSKPAASQHLKVLREAELVDVRVDGTRRLYRARAEQLAAVRSLLDAFWGDRLGRLKAQVER
jgi:DNA-binding transcriptional ArsR family regulator